MVEGIQEVMNEKDSAWEWRIPAYGWRMRIGMNGW